MMHDYQAQVDVAVHGMGKDYWPPLVILARVAEEVGEASLKLLHEHLAEDPEQREVYNGHQDIFMNFAHALCNVGEYGRDISHLTGMKKKRTGPHEDESLSDELGDVLFTVICLANSKGINLDDALEHAILKCGGRDKDRFRSQGEGV